MLSDQNNPEQLDRLAAQRQFYSDAKSVESLRMLVVGPGALLVSAAALRWPSLRPLVALYALVAISADDLWLIPWTKQLRTTAAKVQELFDCSVLELPWNTLKIGRQPELERISEASGRDKRSKPGAGLVSWYPNCFLLLPIEASRIACQRINCWWDQALRLKFKRTLVASALAMTILFLLIGLAGGMTIPRLLLIVVAPAVPVWSLVVRRIREDSESSAAALRLKENAEDLWAAVSAGSATVGSLSMLSRQLQNEIYDHRCRASLIPDLFYNLSRQRQESQMDDSAERLTRKFFEKRARAIDQRA
jgi:uncharacterized membrane protein YhaH (DUF805 family)